MEDTIFFKPKGPFSLNKLIDACNYIDKIHDIKILDKANEKDITFLNLQDIPNMQNILRQKLV